MDREEKGKEGFREPDGADTQSALALSLSDRLSRFSLPVCIGLCTYPVQPVDLFPCLSVSREFQVRWSESSLF